MHFYLIKNIEFFLLIEFLLSIEEALRYVNLLTTLYVVPLNVKFSVLDLILDKIISLCLLQV